MKETEEDELREDLKFGWRMFETPEVEFYVTHEDEDVYIDEDGDVREEPVYFNDHMDANTGFSKFLKRRKEEAEEAESEADIKREEEEYETDWGSSEVERKIDGFWYLTYQESEPTGEERRWAVFYPDRDFHVGPDGMLTRSGSVRRTRRWRRTRSTFKGRKTWESCAGSPCRSGTSSSPFPSRLWERWYTPSLSPQSSPGR